jgi:hypothetical protein
MDQPAVTGGRDAYAQAALFGLGIYFVAAIVIAVAVAIFAPEDAVFLLFLFIPGIIAGVAIRFLRRWGLIIGGLLAAFGLSNFVVDLDLFLNPESFFDFLLTTFSLVGLGIALIACVVGTVQYFRGAVPTEIPPTIATGLRAIAGVLVVAALASAVLTILSATDNVSAEEREGALELVAESTEWEQETLETRAGQPIRIFLKNDDPIIHTFTIEDAARDIDIDHKMPPFSEKVVELEGLQAGTYGFICRVVGHEEDMTGVLTVR